jgi:hypothetical protein
MAPDPAQFFSVAANLGVAGFSVWIMWKMFQSNADERRANDIHIRGLEKEVRDRIMEQLNKNTETMNQVIKHMQAHERQSPRDI